MIANLKRRFIALPTWARYTLIAVFLPILIPLFLIAGLLISTHELIATFSKE